MISGKIQYLPFYRRTHKQIKIQSKFLAEINQNCSCRSIARTCFTSVSLISTDKSVNSEGESKYCKYYVYWRCITSGDVDWIRVMLLNVTNKIDQIRQFIVLAMTSSECKSNHFFCWLHIYRSFSSLVKLTCTDALTTSLISFII